MALNIRARVYEQILYALEADLRGGELLMKEAWEDCETADDLAVAKDELAKIIGYLRVHQASVARPRPRT